MSRLKWKTNSLNNIKNYRNKNGGYNSYGKSKNANRLETKGTKTLRCVRDKLPNWTKRSVQRSMLTNQWKKITSKSLCCQKFKNVMNKLSHDTLKTETLLIQKIISMITNVTKTRTRKQECEKSVNRKWRLKNESNRWISSTHRKRAIQLIVRRKRFKSVWMLQNHNCISTHSP